MHCFCWQADACLNLSTVYWYILTAQAFCLQYSVRVKISCSKKPPPPKFFCVHCSHVPFCTAEAAATYMRVELPSRCLDCAGNVNVCLSVVAIISNCCWETMANDLVHSLLALNGMLNVLNYFWQLWQMLLFWLKYVDHSSCQEIVSFWKSICCVIYKCSLQWFMWLQRKHLLICNCEL